jgi:hypothetical protein
MSTNTTKLEQMNRLLVVLQDARQDGLFRSNRKDDCHRADLKAEIRWLLGEIEGLVVTGVL